MPQDQVRPRPKRYPPPEFPPRRPKLFAKTPPAIFPVVLGLLGLGLAARAGAGLLGLPGALVEMLLGMMLGAWAFAVLAYGVKTGRRPGVVIEDLRVLPGRAGLAAATMSGMAAAAVLAPYAPGPAFALALMALGLHLVLAVALIWVLWHGPKEARGVNPSWHLSFVGFIVAAPVLARLGQGHLAFAIFAATLPLAAAIWGISLAQLIGRIPPAPLRPMLAIHLSPAALFATTALLLDQPMLAQSFALFGAVMLVALFLAARWMLVAGFSALWGALTFPLAAYAAALITMGGGWAKAGLVLLVLAVPVIGGIAWRVIKLWPGGRLAAKTNAAEA